LEAATRPILEQTGVAAASPPTVADLSDTPTGDGNVVEQIVVEGAGELAVNGTYKRCKSHDDLPFCCDREVPVFSKCSSWEGEEVSFIIYRYNRRKQWFVSYYAPTPGSERFFDDDTQIYIKGEILPTPHTTAALRQLRKITNLFTLHHSVGFILRCLTRVYIVSLMVIYVGWKILLLISIICFCC
jgi:hypothetical protein